MPDDDPRYHPLYYLALEVDAVRRSMHVLVRQVYRETKMDVVGFNWEVIIVMRYIFIQGPQTIPQLARFHKTTRQHIAEVVASLADKGYVTVSDNPRHKRSRLVHLTEKGASLLRFATDKWSSICDCLGRNLDLRATDDALQLLRQVRLAIDTKKWRDYDKSPYSPPPNCNRPPSQTPEIDISAGRDRNS